MAIGWSSGSTRSRIRITTTAGLRKSGMPLEWLATTYHDSQTGEAQIIDLNESIRNTCGGWEYKSNQTDITFNMYREWYTTTKDGKTYELRKHLSKGTGRDANVIRIAFAWDEDSERVIVGFVGPHQRSRSS